MQPELTNATALPEDVSRSPQDLRARIERASAEVSKPLSTEAQAQLHQSLGRFYQYVNGYCGSPEKLEAATTSDLSCIRNKYYNYLAGIADSVYRVGAYTVYETGVYGLLWPDESLQAQDSSRAGIWDLNIVWPRVDAHASPLSGKAGDALSDLVHERASRWISVGWELYVNVRLEELSECYVSARITESSYGGGAHPVEAYRVFNWNRRAGRPLASTDLFRDGSNWQREMLGRYRKRLGAAADGLTDENLLWWIQHGFVITAQGLRIIAHEGRTRVNGPLPDIDFLWNELSAWLIPSAVCSADRARASGEATP